MAFPGSYSPSFTPRQSDYDDDPFSHLRSAQPPSSRSAPRPPGSISGSFLRPGDGSIRGDSRSPGSVGARQLKATDLVRDVSSWLSKKRGKTTGPTGWSTGAGPGGAEARPWRGANEEMEWRNPGAGVGTTADQAFDDGPKPTTGEDGGEDEEETLKRVMEQSKREAEGIEEREARELEEALALSRNDVPAPAPALPPDAVNGSAFLDEGAGGNETDDEDAEAELSRALRESERLLRQASLASPDSPTAPSTMRAHLPPPGAAPPDEKNFLEEDRMLELAVRLSLEERALYEEARNMAELAETTATWAPSRTAGKKGDKERARRRVPPLPKPISAPDPTRMVGEGEATPRAEQPESPQSAGSPRRRSLLEEQLAAASIGASPPPPPRDQYTRKPLTPPSGSPPPAAVVDSTPPFPSRPPPPVPVATARKLPQPPPVPPKRPLEDQEKIAFPTAPAVYSPPAQPDPRARMDSDPTRSNRSSTSSTASSSSSGPGRPPGPSQDPSYQSFHTAPPGETPEAALSSPDSLDDASLDADSPLDGPPLGAGGSSMYPRPSLTIGPYDAQRSLSHITEHTEPDDDGTRSLAAASTRPPSSMSSEDGGAASTVGLESTNGLAAFADADETPEQVFDDAEEDDELAVRRLADVDTGLETGVAPQLSTATTVRGAGPAEDRGTATPRASTPVQEHPMATASAAGSQLTHQSSTVDSPGFGNSVRFGFPDGADGSNELAPPSSTTGRSSAGVPDVIMLSKERRTSVEVVEGARRGEAGSAIGPVWAVDAASWSLLLRFLMWYGESELRVSPTDDSPGASDANDEAGAVQKGRRSAALSVEFRKGGEGPGCVRLTVRLLDDEADGRGYESSGSNLTGGSGGEELGGSPLNKKVRKRLQRRKGKGKANPALAETVSIDRVPLPDAVVLPTRLAQLAVTLFTLGHLAGIAVSTQGAKGATASYRELRRLGSLIADLAEAHRQASLASGRQAVEDGEADAGGDERLIGRMRERLRRLRNRQTPSTAMGTSAGSTGQGLDAGQAVMQQTAQASAATGLQPSTVAAAAAPVPNFGGEAMEPSPSQHSHSSADEGEGGRSGRSSVRLRRRSRSSIERTRRVSRDLRLLMDDGDEPDHSTDGGHSGEAVPRDEPARDGGEEVPSRVKRPADQWDHEDRLRWLPNLAR